MKSPLDNTAPSTKLTSPPDEGCCVSCVVEPPWSRCRGGSFVDEDVTDDDLERDYVDWHWMESGNHGIDCATGR